MTDPRTALEAAFKVIHPAPCDPRYPDDDEDFAWCKLADRFRRCLDAEAWESAALTMVLPEWKAMDVDATEPECGVDVRLYHKTDAHRVAIGTADELWDAIRSACIKAKESGDDR